MTEAERVQARKRVLQQLLADLIEALKEDPAENPGDTLNEKTCACIDALKANLNELEE